MLASCGRIEVFLSCKARKPVAFHCDGNYCFDACLDATRVTAQERGCPSSLISKGTRDNKDLGATRTMLQYVYRAISGTY